MKKIFYPVLLLALTACKGNQQTTDTESVTVPVSEVAADTTAQPEVDAITSATSKPNQVSFNGRIVLPPQRQATIALTMGGVVKNTSLLPGQYVSKNAVIATLENPDLSPCSKRIWTATHKPNTFRPNSNVRRTFLPNKQPHKRNTSKAKRIISP